MKKLTIALLALLMVFTVGCGKTEEADASGKQEKTAKSAAQTAKTEKKTEKKAETKALTTTAAAEAEKTYEEYALGHGIALETDYYMFGNTNWGSIALLSDGTVEFYHPEEGEYSALWYADEDGVYLVNPNNEEFTMSLYENGNVFVVDEVPCFIDGFASPVSYVGTYSYQDNHEWADILELDADFSGWYTNLEDGGVYDEGSATMVAFENYAVITPNHYDGNIDPVIVVTDDNGQSFEDEDGRYFYLSDTEESTDPASMARGLDIILDNIYYSDNEENSYFYVGSDGMFYITSPVTGNTVSVSYTISGSYINLYNNDGSSAGSLLFDGENFYDETAGVTYRPY